MEVKVGDIRDQIKSYTSEYFSWRDMEITLNTRERPLKDVRVEITYIIDKPKQV